MNNKKAYVLWRKMRFRTRYSKTSSVPHIKKKPNKMVTFYISEIIKKYITINIFLPLEGRPEG